MIEYAATLYTGILYAGLVIAVIFATYLVVTTRADRKRGFAAGLDMVEGGGKALSRERTAPGADREATADEERARRGAA